MTSNRNYFVKCYQNNNKNQFSEKKNSYPTSISVCTNWIIPDYTTWPIGIVYIGPAMAVEEERAVVAEWDAAAFRARPTRQRRPARPPLGTAAVTVVTFRTPIGRHRTR